MKRYNWKEERASRQSWKAKTQDEPAETPSPAQKQVPETRAPRNVVQWLLLAVFVCGLGFFVYTQNTKRHPVRRVVPAPRNVPSGKTVPPSPDMKRTPSVQSPLPKTSAQPPLPKTSAQPPLPNPPARSAASGKPIAPQRQSPKATQAKAEPHPEYIKRLLAEADEAFRRKDVKSAEKKLKEAIAAGSLKAKLIFSALLIQGLGLPQNIELGLKMLRETADAGFLEARVFLAAVLLEGKYVKKDIPNGIKNLKMAADAGYAEAQFIMSEILSEGKYVAKNPTLSLEYLKKAAAQGHTAARIVLKDRMAKPGNQARIIKEEKPLFHNVFPGSR